MLIQLTQQLQVKWQVALQPATDGVAAADAVPGDYGSRTHNNTMSSAVLRMWSCVVLSHRRCVEG